MRLWLLVAVSPRLRVSASLLKGEIVKEQVIAPRAGRGGAGKGRGGSAAAAQRPARRERGSAGRSGSRLRRALSYVPLFAKFALAIGVGLLLFFGYRAAASATFFQPREIDVSGTARVSTDEVRAAVRRAVAPVGVWDADLAALSAEIERLPWVRTAVVSRVLPAGIRVRVTERAPLAVARLSSGRLVWVDEDAVALGAFAPTDRMPAFFVRGLDEASAETARRENRARLRAYQEMLREWEAAGSAARISEVNLEDLRDVRAQLSGNDSQIEVRLGGSDFGLRLEQALKTLDEQRQTPRGIFITRLDATLVTRGADGADGRIIVGYNPSAPAALRAGGSVVEPASAVGPARGEATTAAAATTTANRREAARENSASGNRAAERSSAPQRQGQATRDASRQNTRQAGTPERERPASGQPRTRQATTPSAVSGSERPRRVGTEE